MMEHIRQRDWCSTRRYNDAFIDDQDMENCVIERILRNKFWDPMISDDEEEPPPVGPIDWNSVFKKKNDKVQKFRIFVPGHRVPPPHPKISALTRDEHYQGMKVLCMKNENILPRHFVRRPSKTDLKAFEEKQEIYTKEQKEYIEWARSLWVSTNFVRALRPKPIVEMVYEAEFKMRTHKVQAFPKMYRLAAQIPLKDDKHNCEIIMPKRDMIEVDISQLPEVFYPDLYEKKVSILQARAVPEPCMQHPCKFKLPNERSESLLPLLEIHSELAQFANENGADHLASERALACLLELDRSWTLPLSVCEVIAADGDKSNVVVLGSDFPLQREPAPTRTYNAFKHLLQKAFTKKAARTRKLTDRSDSSAHNMRLRTRKNSYVTAAGAPRGSPRRSDRHALSGKGKGPSKIHSGEKEDSAAAVFTKSLRRIVALREANEADSDDEDRLEIDLGENQNPEAEVFPFTAAADTVAATSSGRNDLSYSDNRRSSGDSDCSPPRKILRAQRSSTTTPPTASPLQTSPLQTSPLQTSPLQTSPHQASPIQEDQIEIDLFNCVCKDSEFEVPPQRSYKNWQIKNYTTREQMNIIIHCSHKLQNGRSNEVILEPIIEYQLDIGGTEQSRDKLQSLAFSLMLRNKANLTTVRVEGTGGELVTIDTVDLKEFTAAHGDFRKQTANSIYTAVSQLSGLLPGVYLLQHEPQHGSNAFLFSPGGAGGARGSASLALDTRGAPPAGAEARAVATPPRLAPVLLPAHKHRHQLPLAFTHDPGRVSKEPVKPSARAKVPPAGLQWPKKRKNKINRNGKKTM